MITRRALLAGLPAPLLAGFAPEGLRLGAPDRRALWDTASGPHLRGAVFSQRRVYEDVDGPSFLGPGPVGAPISRGALDSLAEAGANLAVWSGPGPLGEGGDHAPDAAIEDHIAGWLDRCRAAGLYTVLAFRSGPGRSDFAFHPDGDWYPRALYDVSVWEAADKQAAWAEMTARALRLYGGHPACAGVLSMVEPNGADMGHPGVWAAMARTVADACADVASDAPLILSPDRWARASHSAEIEPLSDRAVIAVHDYEPWTYTHEGAPDFRDAGRTFLERRPDAERWAVLEFGAGVDAPDLAAYYADCVERLEAAGANWSCWRWTSGWEVYEAREGGMDVTRHDGAMAVLRRAWRGNTARPA